MSYSASYQGLLMTTTAAIEPFEYIYIYIYVCVCVCVRACVRACMRETDRKKDTQRQKKREKIRQSEREGKRVIVINYYKSNKEQRKNVQRKKNQHHC